MTDEMIAQIETQPGKSYQLARWVSNIFSPVLAAVYVTALLAFSTVQPPAQALLWLSITVLIAAIPSVSFIFYLVKIGYLEDFFMPDRSRRLKPIAAIFGWLVFSMGILYTINAPPVLIWVVVGVSAQVALLGLITFLWKISFHSATVISAATVTSLLGLSFAWAIWILVPIVGWSRVKLQRHTTLQVLAGLSAGFAISVIAFYIIDYYIPLR